MKRSIPRTAGALLPAMLLLPATLLAQDSAATSVAPPSADLLGGPVSYEAYEPTDTVPLRGAVHAQAGASHDTAQDAPSSDRFYLGFAAGEYVPPATERLDPRLAARALELANRREAGASDRGTVYGFILFGERITAGRRAELEALGVRLLGFHPGYNLKAALPVATLDAVAALPFVRWVGEARPWQKVHPELTRRLAAAPPGEEIEVEVTVFESDLSDEATFESVGEALGFDPTAAQTSLSLVDGASQVVYSNGWQQRALEAEGVLVGAYEDSLTLFHVRTTPERIEALATLDHVQFIEPHWIEELAHGESTAMVNADRMRLQWDGSTSGEVVVGMVDSGMESSHFGLNHLWIWGYTWVSGQSSFDDVYGHGSAVAGTLAGDGGGQLGRQGVASGLGFATDRRFVNLRIFDDNGGGGYASASQVINRLRNPLPQDTPRPHVVNHSYGVIGSDFLGTESRARAFDNATYTDDQLHVFAAGNEANPGRIRLEACAKNVLTVGSVVDYDAPGAGPPGTRAFSSSQGPTGDGRWKPNLVAPGAVIETVDSSSPSAYKLVTGTSYAAPHVSGVAALVADRYSFLRYRPHTLSAVLMASAMAKDDELISTPGSAHLNTYGTGRVDAMRAAPTSQQSLSFYSMTSTPTNLPNVTLEVQPGATRMTVVMHYIEEGASAGASEALVNDLDLWIDRAPFTSGATGEFFAHQSSVSNTEVRTIANPIPAEYRFKVEPRSATSSSRVGLSIVVTYGDTTPDVTLDLQASAEAVQPGQLVTISGSVHNPSYTASAVLVESTSSANYHSATNVLYGGIDADVSGNPTGGRDILLGNLRGPSSRTAEWGVSWNTEGVHNFSVTASGDNIAEVTEQVQVVVDGTAPSAVPGVFSPTHQVDALSCNGVVTMNWDSATDSLSGLDFYAYEWSSSPGTVPDSTSPNLNHAAVGVNGLVGTGTHYFHIRAVDEAGNYGPTTHVGPFVIETSPVSNYCTGKVNSDGCVPSTLATGSPTLSGADNFHLRCLEVVPGRPGIMFWGHNPSSAPFSGGTRCVGFPLQRTPAQHATDLGGIGCSGAYDFHFTQAYMASHGLTPGDTIHAQFWMRDPQDAFGTGLSDGLRFEVCQ